MVTADMNRSKRPWWREAFTLETVALRRRPQSAVPFRVSTLAMGLAAVLAVASCESDEGGPSAGPTPSPTPTPSPPPTPPASSWNPAERVSGFFRFESSVDGWPAVAAGGGGRAVAVWAQPGDSGREVWSNRYEPGTGWAGPERVEGDLAGEASSPLIVMDLAGNAMAIWRREEGDRSRIRFNRFEPASGWQAPASLDDGENGEAHDPRISMGETGVAVAVWLRRSEGETSLWASNYTPGEGWAAAQQIDGGGPTQNLQQVVAVNASGQAIALWAGGVPRFNLFENGVGWGEAAAIPGTDFAGDIAGVAIDPAGNAIALWRSWPDAFLVGRRYEPGAGWSRMDGMFTGEGASLGGIVMDSSGTAFLSASAMWQPSTWVQRFVPGTGWEPIVPLDDNLWAGAARIALCPTGEAVAIWTFAEQSGSSSTESSFFDAATGWSSKESIPDAPRGDDVAMTADCQAVAVGGRRWGNGSLASVWASTSP